MEKEEDRQGEKSCTGTDHLAQELVPYKVASSTKLKRTRDYAKGTPIIINLLCHKIHYVNVKTCQVRIKVYQPNVLLNKHLQNPGINPWKETNRPRDRLKNKAKIKSHAYIQLGEKALQTVHQTFEPNIPMILNLSALTNTTTDTDTVPMLFIIQEGIN